jgi:hypothetical protein
MKKQLTIAEKAKSDARLVVFKEHHAEAKKRFAAGERVAHPNLGKYSILNQLLIIIQCPHVQEVHGFWEWQDLGFAVQKGQEGIAIRAPHAIDDEDEDRVGYHRVYVWDISQVAPLTEEQMQARAQRKQKHAA